ncbi:peroxisome proliferator-activated receptor gamma coactivator-related protein like protein [Tanacetum coccineum]|uniref:Peroxisome proliferator-activated receptor gamma coactivator-related protein like protein n=1 Tax=Tanacetum coccineum TaxID=301880 RepID=A0ABQ5BTP5_9ASTR
MRKARDSEEAKMLGSLDCTDWEWFGCPYAFKGKYVRRDHGSNPFILLEAVASIYPELAIVVKTISEPTNDDKKRILYKLNQESARKDVQRAFGVLKKK